MGGVFATFERAAATPVAPPSSLISRVRSLFKTRDDGEHQIAFNRLAAGFVYAFLMPPLWIFSAHPNAFELHVFYILLVIYLAAITAHMLAFPAASVARRVVGTIGDIALVAWPLYYAPHQMSYMFIGLYWAVFGIGFRYGVPWILFAASVATVEFCVVLATTQYWKDNFAFSFGVAGGLIILPLYASILIRQLSEARRVAEEANKAKTLFLASVSHELRTPLNAIIGLSDLLADSQLDHEQVGMSRVIGSSGRSLLSLINTILDVSRIECGFPNAKPENVDLDIFLADVRDMTAVQAKAKNIDMFLHIAPNVARVTAFNRRHVEEVLVNFIGNAIKFTERGHVAIDVGATPAGEGRQRLRVEVSDTGIGVPAHALERIFDRFTQADETIIDRFGGTGLGLAIARQLIEGMGGKIGVESAIGVGSTFWFEFECDAVSASVAGAPGDVLALSRDQGLRPLLGVANANVVALAELALMESALALVNIPGRRHVTVIVDVRGQKVDAETLLARARALTAQADVDFVGLFEAGVTLSGNARRLMASAIVAPPNAAAMARALEIANVRERRDAEAARSAKAASPKRALLNILVAEDTRTNQLVIRKVLERAGHAVTIVSDGQLALEQLTARRFDIALMDVNMPVLNGVDACKLYQFTLPNGDVTPIAALTADATVDTQRRCLDAGMIACITKPIESDRLIAWLDDFSTSRAIPKPTVVAETPVATLSNREPSESAIDDRKLSDLKLLGGDEFVAEIVDQFLGDAATVLRKLHEAVDDGDVQKFRDEAHALRSCAANVGAQAVYKLCLDWRAIDARELALEGEIRVRRLEREFEKARTAIEAYRRIADLDG